MEEMDESLLPKKGGKREKGGWKKCVCVCQWELSLQQVFWWHSFVHTVNKSNWKCTKKGGIYSGNTQGETVSLATLSTPASMINIRPCSTSHILQIFSSKRYSDMGVTAFHFWVEYYKWRESYCGVFTVAWKCRGVLEEDGEKLTLLKVPWSFHIASLLRMLF